MSNGELFLKNLLKKQIIKFLDELIQKFPSYGEFILIRIYINDQVSVDEIMGRFMNRALPYQNIIKSRNSKLFTDTNILKKFFINDDEQKNYNNMKKLWSELDDDEQDTIWTWVDHFVKIVNKYYSKYGCVQNWDIDIYRAIQEIDSKYNI